MTVLVCGGRDYADRARVALVLASVGARRVIEGGARGADQLAREWARGRHIPVTTFPAEWQREGRRAGPIRNQRMIDEGRPDLVVAFPGGLGTADMVRRAHRAWIIVIEVSA